MYFIQGSSTSYSYEKLLWWVFSSQPYQLPQTIHIPPIPPIFPPSPISQQWDATTSIPKQSDLDAQTTASTLNWADTTTPPDKTASVASVTVAK